MRSTPATWAAMPTSCCGRSRPASSWREHGDEVCPAKWQPGAETLKPSLDLVGHAVSHGQTANSSYDVVIIGGGPAGLTAGLYLARARYRVLVVEKDRLRRPDHHHRPEVVNYPGVAPHQRQRS